MTSIYPLISVIIPTYNRAELIVKAIDSVLNQSYKNIEVLVIDDQSEDNTENIVKCYTDTRVQYLLNTRTKGAQGARNTGLYAAKGEWVAFLDSDDVWHPEKLEYQIFLSEDKEDLSCVAVNYTYKSFIDLSENENNQVTQFGLKDLLYHNSLGGFSCIMCKREIAYKVGGLDEEFKALQDVDFYIRLCRKGSIIKTSRTLVKMKVDHPDRISKQFSKKLDSAVLFYEKYGSLIKEDIILKNKAISRIIMFSLLSNKYKKVIIYLPWIFIGLVIDFDNSVKVFKRVMGNLLRWS